MYLEVLTPGKTVFSGDIKLIKVPGSDGAFEVMNNHAPIISSLQEGNVKIIPEDGEVLNIGIKGGVIQVLKNQIIVLAESLIEA
ncbi:MAG TPA: ATP synthase F1 subunit epsilon [Bacteroidales bacterium]|nr:ATP synthase F1 subunit epsilon [Bacteroidales bacterium]